MSPPNAPGAVRKGQNMPRSTPPHPQNSGSEALNKGIAKLREHQQETHKQPGRVSTGNGDMSSENGKY